MNKGKKAYISTLACALAHKESQIFKDYFVRNGYIITNNLLKADVIVLNLCASNKIREKYNFQYIENMKKQKKKDARLVVIGCISRISEEGVRKLKPDAYFPPLSYSEMDNYFQFENKLSDFKERGVMDTNPGIIHLRAFLNNNPWKEICAVLKNMRKVYPFLYRYTNLAKEFNLSRKVFSLTISTGCNNKCSYCAIRLARGPLKSMPPQEVLAIIKKAIQDGYRKIYLLGTSPCQYGEDLENGIGYFDLLKKICELGGTFKLVLPDFNPHAFVLNYPTMKTILYENKILEMAFSIQSGSPKILKAMNRYYDISKFKSYVHEIRQYAPQLLLNCHVIVGFPGETVEDFELTRSLVKECQFDAVYVFEYGDRPGTRSSTFSNHLPEEVTGYRAHLLTRSLFFESLKIRFKKIFLRGSTRAQGPPNL